MVNVKNTKRELSYQRMTKQYPKVLRHPKFISIYRDYLVTLGQAPGLGIRITGNENIVTTMPRFSHPIQTYNDLLSLTWISVVYAGTIKHPEFTSALMSPQEVKEFLKCLQTFVSTS